MLPSSNMALDKGHQITLETLIILHLGASQRAWDQIMFFVLLIKNNLTTSLHRFYMLCTKTSGFVETL